MYIKNQDLKILKQISKESGIDKFWLGGSIPYYRTAKKLGKNFNYSDYDLAIKGGKKEYISIKNKLKKNNFEIIQSRPYFLKFKKIFQIVAKKKAIILDIAIVKKLSYLGHFNWERIFWSFPSGKIYDPYHSLKAIEMGKLRLTITPKRENPLILISRFTKICARFDINFVQNKKLFRMAKRLARLVKKWKTKDSFHGKYAKEHAYFGILQAISRSKNKKKFLSMLQKSNILDALFPEINQKLIGIDVLNINFKKIKNEKDVANLFRDILKINKKQRKLLDRKLEIISGRLDKK